MTLEWLFSSVYKLQMTDELILPENTEKSKAHILRRLIHYFFERRWNNLIREKEKLHDLLIDTMLFAEKQSNDFYAGLGKNKTHALRGWSVH